MTVASAMTVCAATWTSPDGLATITADAITESSGTLALSGSSIDVKVVGTGDAVIYEAVTVSGSLSIDVPEGASLTFNSISSSDGTELNRLTKRGGGDLIIASGTLKSQYSTYDAGGITLSNGASLLLDSELLVGNAQSHSINLLSGATLRCARPRASTKENGMNTTFHIDGGILQPTKGGTWIFANIANVTIGEKGLIVDTSYITSKDVNLFGVLGTADGVATDGGVRVRGTSGQSSLIFYNSYTPVINGGVKIENGGSVACADEKDSGNLALAEQSVIVQDGGELRITASLKRLSTIKSLKLGEKSTDRTYLRFSKSHEAVLIITDSLVINGKVKVRFPDTFTCGTCNFLRAPKGTLDASCFILDPVPEGSTVDFTVDTSNADYDMLVMSATSSVKAINPETSGNSELKLKNQTLRVISPGIVANPVTGEAEEGFVLDARADAVFSNSFQNAGYFIKTGSGKVTLSYPGDIRISGKSGNINTYQDSKSPLVFPVAGEMPTVDDNPVFQAGSNVMDFNVLAGTLAFSASGEISHKGDMLVGGNKLFLDKLGNPVPSSVELHDGSLTIDRILMGDVYAYRNEPGYMIKNPRNALKVFGGAMVVNTAFVVGNYNSKYGTAVNEYHQYGGNVSMPAPYFHIGRWQTVADDDYSDAGQSSSLFAVHGGTFMKMGKDYFRVSDSGGNAKIVFDGGTSTISRLAIAAQTSETDSTKDSRDTKTLIELSGGTLAVSNVTLKSSFAGMASWRWNGTTFKPLVDSATATRSFEGPWTTNAVDAGGAVFDLSGMDAGTAFSMNIPLTHAAALGATPDGGVHVTDGSGCLVLAAANTFTGPLVVDGGSVRVDADGAIPETATVTVNGDGVLDLGGRTVTIAHIRGDGGKIRNGVLRVAGTVSASSLTIENLVLADGATISVPLVCEDGIWMAGSFTVTSSFQAEGPVGLSLSGVADGTTVPDDLSVRIATLPVGSQIFPGTVAENHISGNCRLRFESVKKDGVVELRAAVSGMPFIIVVR
jgi:autotransporter-associated beta strand protein